MLNTIKPGELSKSFDYNNNNLGKHYILNTDLGLLGDTGNSMESQQINNMKT
jgi:hypothetical protein